MESEENLEKKLEEKLEKKFDFTNTKCNKNNNRNYSSGVDCVYGLGVIGAAIFFIGKATTFGAGALGLLKAILWPAFMVYEVFKLLIK